MKNTLLGIVIGLLIGGGVVWTVIHHHDEASQTEPETTEGHGEQTRVLKGTNGEIFLKLDKETQERAGLKLGALEPAQLKPEIKAFGRVMDPTPLALAVVDLAATRAQLEASTKEFDRSKILHTQNQNVSARALEAAEAAVKRDQSMRDTAQLRFATTWGKSLVSMKDLDGFVQALVSQQSGLLRIDLPAGEMVSGLPVAARVAPITAPDQPLEAEFLGLAPSVDPQTQGRGYLFLLKTNVLVPNTAVVSWLSFPGPPRNGVVIPREAIVRHQGAAFVYMQTSDTIFQRRLIELDRPLGQGWFAAADGLDPKANVVVVGAQQLLSEELKGEGGGEE